ncbi:MAG TPA: S4 domain-containing protein, partial [Buchnera sp. (in: enterobacteria)]|nr:S4 domain-containing protein [Buchnera sp. (in: enterobacteria)]
MKNDIKKITYNNTITITEDKAEQRIDNFLIKNYKKIPKSALYKIIRTGKLKINKKKVKPQYKLKIGDYIYIPIKKSEDIKNTSQKINIKIIQNISNNILYEDKYLLVINKECGIAVHGGSGINLGIIETIRILKPKNHFLEL